MCLEWRDLRIGPLAHFEPRLILPLPARCWLYLSCSRHVKIAETTQQKKIARKTAMIAITGKESRTGQTSSAQENTETCRYAYTLPTRNGTSGITRTSKLRTQYGINGTLEIPRITATSSLSAYLETRKSSSYKASHPASNR